MDLFLNLCQKSLYLMSTHVRSVVIVYSYMKLLCLCITGVNTWEELLCLSKESLYAYHEERSQVRFKVQGHIFKPREGW